MLGGGLILGGVLVGCAGSDSETSTPTASQDGTPKATLKVLVPVKGTFQPEHRAWGRLEAGLETIISAQVSGPVQYVSPDLYPGRDFSAGEILLEIDPLDFELRRVQASSEISAARLHLKEQEAEAELAFQEAPANAHDDRSALALREPQLAAAKDRLAAAQATLTQAELDLERTTVTAPMDCRVLERKAEVGQWVQQGTPLAVLQSSDFLEARLPLSPSVLALLSIRPETVAHLEVDEISLGEARLHRLETDLDPETGLGYGIFRLPSPFAADKQGHAQPGRLIQARFATGPEQEVLWVPRSSLKAGALLVESDGTFMMTKVEVLATRDDWVAVSLDSTSPDPISARSVALEQPAIFHSALKFGVQKVDVHSLDLGPVPISEPASQAHTTPLFEREADRPAQTSLADPAEGIPTSPDTAASLPQSTGPSLTTREAQQTSKTSTGLENFDRLGEILGWDFSLDNDELEVQLSLSKSSPIFRNPDTLSSWLPVVTATEPPVRWVVDLPGFHWAPSPSRKTVDAPPFQLLRLARFQDHPTTARVALYFEPDETLSANEPAWRLNPSVDSKVVPEHSEIRIRFQIPQSGTRAGSPQGESP